MDNSRGFEELPHTADWSMRVWAEDLPGLFAEAARGMNTLSGMQMKPAPSAHRTFQHEALDNESLLVAFLSELIYLQEHEGLGFDGFEIAFDGHRLHVEMQGAPLAEVMKPIKAVTFHNLRITQAGHGCETTIVFDV